MGLGVIATRDLACGEAVLAERPVLAFGKRSGGVEAVQRQFDALPADAQRTIFDLHDQFAAAGQGKTLDGIVRSNCYGCDSEVFNTILCPTVSRFNHSCSPNCEQSWDDRLQEQQIYASRAIHAGEELCTYFVDVVAPTSERATALWDGHGIRCRCLACRRPSALSDQRRRWLQRLQRDIPDIGGDDPARGHRMVLRLLHLYDEEEMHIQSLRRQACFYALQFSLMLEAEARARRWAERAYGYSVMCQGPGHSETQRCRKLAEDPESFYDADHP